MVQTRAWVARIEGMTVGTMQTQVNIGQAMWWDVHLGRQVWSSWRSGLEWGATGRQREPSRGQIRKIYTIQER